MLPDMPITPPHSTSAAEPNGLARLVGGAARGASRRPKLTIVLWLALVVGCLVAGGLSGTRQLSRADRPGPHQRRHRP